MSEELLAVYFWFNLPWTKWTYHRVYAFYPLDATRKHTVIEESPTFDYLKYQSPAIWSGTDLQHTERMHETAETNETKS